MPSSSRLHQGKENGKRRCVKMRDNCSFLTDNSINSAQSPPPKLSKESEFDLSSAYVPAFGGDSFLELPTLRHVGRAFAIELWFLALEPDGILLYDGQGSNGDGDFVYLGLEGGRLALRFDLGGGAVAAVTEEAVELGRWHAAAAGREGTSGWVRLDAGREAKAEAAPGLTELNLQTPLYLGGVK